MNGGCGGISVRVAGAVYTGFALAFTWPLVRGLTRDIPGDFGDPLLNSWILAWDATHLGRGWWNANIFHPHPLALAYSEHLAALAAPVAPIYWLTANPVLCYNLLFLSTYILSGVGMFLFARELTGDGAAALVAGFAYAFAPFRVASQPHLQVLASAWMPFTLWGFRRYFETRRPLPLAGGAAAWLLQNLSCGYYLLYFSPVVVMYLLWEVTTRRLWRDGRALAATAAACAAVGAATLPFLWPYLELRRAGFAPRSLTEVQQFSADVYAYFTADSSSWLWGSVARAWPKAEGSLFPGLTVTVLAAWAGLKAFGRVGRLAPVFATAAAVLVALLLDFSIRFPGVKITNLFRALVVVSLAGAAVVILSRDLRIRVVSFLKTPEAIFAAITLFAVVMSFGPTVYARGRSVLDTNLYAFFYNLVPGYDGLRVPARFAMIVALGLSVLAALSLRVLRSPRTLTTLLVMSAIGLESFSAPIPINQNSTTYVRPGLAPLPPLALEPPAVYGFVASLPTGSAIVELPLGEPAFDVRYMFHSRHHWKPLVNGYSGGAPADYELLDHRLQDALSRPGEAWSALTASGATHVVLHEAFYAGTLGAAMAAWLASNGAREIAAFETDRVFRLP